VKVSHLLAPELGAPRSVRDSNHDRVQVVARRSHEGITSDDKNRIFEEAPKGESFVDHENTITSTKTKEVKRNKQRETSDGSKGAELSYSNGFKGRIYSPRMA
jgi:hypothetical protein